MSGDVPWGGLAEPHRELLRSSGVDWPTAKARGYWSAHAARQMADAGIVTAGRRPPALMIPLWDVLGQRAGYQARPDLPRFNGHGRQVKYETPHRQRVVVDVNPAARAAVHDNSRPLFVTEGSRKADSLWVAGGAAVSLAGVWNWRNGDGVLPDWDEIPLRGRLIYVVFDSDVMLKTQVHAACARLGGILLKRGAEIAYVYLPARGDGSKQGVDDFMASGHALTDVVGLAEGVVRSRVSTPPNTGAQPHTPPPVAPLEAPPLASDVRILDRFGADIERMGVHGEQRTARTTFLEITSRLLARPVSGIVKGLSASGKSYTVDSTVEFFPAEAVLVLTGMSEHALVYSSESYVHRTLVIGEATALREGNEENMTAYFVRSLLSEGRIRYPVTIRNPSDGTFTTQEIVKEGPTNVIITTTKAKVHAENETRLLSIMTDDSRDQTSRVLAALADESDRAVDLDEWHRLQRWLAQGERRVTIPYAGDLAKLIPPVAVRLRRDFGAVLSLIRAHALLHRQTRDRDPDGRIVATRDDYDVVRDLVADIVGASVGATVPDTVRETVHVVAELAALKDNDRLVHGDGVRARAVADRLHLDRSTVARRLTVAGADGWLRNLEDKRGKAGRWVPGDPLPEEIDVLPHTCTVFGHETAGHGGVCTCARAREGVETPPHTTPPDDDGEWGPP